MPVEFEAGDLLSLISSLNTNLGQIRDAIKAADATIVALSGAPITASYVVAGALDPSLTGDRLLTGTTNQVTVTDGGAGGAVTLSLPATVILTTALNLTASANFLVFDSDAAVNKGTLTMASLTAARVWTLPDASDTLVGKTTTDVLTNKTLTLPTIGDLSNMIHLHTDNASGGAIAEGAPVGADYLVGTASGDLSAEIVVGVTPQGELGNTWASPTVDSIHSGTAHHAASDPGPPNGTASGQLGGTYPSPTVDASHSGSAHHAQSHTYESHTGTVPSEDHNTATGAAGSGAALDVTMNTYNFFPSVTSTSTSAWTMRSIDNTADPGTQIGKFHAAVGNGNIDINWRYITTSRPPEFVVARHKTTGFIAAAWRSEIEDFDNPPITVYLPDSVTIDPDLEVMEITSFPDRLLSMKIRAVIDELNDPGSGFRMGPRRALPPQAGGNVPDSHPLMQEAKARGRVVYKQAILGEIIEVN